MLMQMGAEKPRPPQGLKAPAHREAPAEEGGLACLALRHLHQSELLPRHVQI